MYKYFQIIGNTENISSWESKGWSNEVIKAPGNTLAQELIYSVKKMYVKFNRSCFKQDKITFNHVKIVNIYIVYALKSTLNCDEDITLKNFCLAQLNCTAIKNADVSKYKYFGYDIGFDGKGAFSHPSGGFGNNTVIFGVNMSSSIHVDSKKKKIFSFLVKILHQD